MSILASLANNWTGEGVGEFSRIDEHSSVLTFFVPGDLHLLTESRDRVLHVARWVDHEHEWPQQLGYSGSLPAGGTIMHASSGGEVVLNRHALRLYCVRW